MLDGKRLGEGERSHMENKVKERSGEYDRPFEWRGIVREPCMCV